jgi:two-component system, NarL family, response regulator NreC
MINVLIADDHNAFVEGISSLLSSDDSICIIDDANTTGDVEKSLKRFKIDVLLLDLSIPTIEKGLELLETISKKYKSVKTIVLTMHDDASIIRQAFASGAKGYLLKNTTKTEIIEAIKQVNTGSQYLNEMVMKILITPTISSSNNQPIQTKITQREKEVLFWISEGLTSAQIAEKLFVSIKAIEFHRNSLLVKFKVSNTAQLIKFAINQHVI